MRYYSSAFPVLASTDGVAYELFLAGCKGYCKGCHSPHTHDKSIGVELDDEFLAKIIEDINRHYQRGLIDNICILGGEPLDNSDDEISHLVEELKFRFPNCKIWLYTHFELEEVELSHPKLVRLLHYIKCGKYIEELASDAGFQDQATKVILASSNQKIYRLY